MDLFKRIGIDISEKYLFDEKNTTLAADLKKIPLNRDHIDKLGKGGRKKIENAITEFGKKMKESPFMVRELGDAIQSNLDDYMSKRKHIFGDKSGSKAETIYKEYKGSLTDVSPSKGGSSEAAIRKLDNLYNMMKADQRDLIDRQALNTDYNSLKENHDFINRNNTTMGALLHLRKALAPTLVYEDDKNKGQDSDLKNKSTEDIYKYRSK